MSEISLILNDEMMISIAIVHRLSNRDEKCTIRIPNKAEKEKIIYSNHHVYVSWENVEELH